MGRRVVVLDRDGTVIHERHYLSDPAQVELIPGVAPALRRLQQLGAGLVVLTNQSGVGRGMFTAQRVEAIHHRMCELLAAEGVRLDGVFYCPHTPEDGCACRKPATGLLERAARQLGFMPQESIVIGDKACDIELGRRVGAATVLVRTGYGAKQAAVCGALADHLVDDVGAAVPMIAQWLARGGAPPRGAATMDCVILCGGRGTRLGGFSAATPKPLLPVNGQPFVLHVVRRMAREGCTRILLAAHYLAQQFAAFVRTYQAEFPGLELLIEPQPLGTGGALRFAAEQVRTPAFLALNGDSWLPQPLAPVLEQHVQAGRRFTAVVIPPSHIEGEPRHKGTWDVQPDGTIRGFTTQELASEGWVNGGLYVADRALVRSWPIGAYSLEANLATLLRGEAAGVFCSTQRLLDIGTPDCYARAAQLLHTTEPATSGMTA